MIKHLTRLHNAILDGGVLIESINSDGQVSPANLQSSAQPIIDAFDDSDAAQSAFDNIQARTLATNAIDSSHAYNDKLLRAIAAVLLDEFNLHADKINSILDAVDAATNLADLKTSIAAIPDYPQRTLAQTITAIKNKIGTGIVD